ncbi:hypothetical protein ABW19_dt0200299 [Dactylella cylindrospora]|nr:hypothetical protein ABW19_dt0200299 [Dactylella cylindrospora]
MAPGVISEDYVNGHVNGNHEDGKVVLPTGHSKPSFDKERVVKPNASNSDTSISSRVKLDPLPAERLVATPPVETFTDSVEITITRVVEETHTIVHNCKKQLGSYRDNPFANAITLQSLTDFIHAQRLRDMPDKGSAWDRILRWALIYAKRIDEFATTIEPYFRSSSSMARDIWSCCRSLLQVIDTALQSCKV